MEEGGACQSVEKRTDRNACATKGLRFVEKGGLIEKGGLDIPV